METIVARLQTPADDNGVRKDIHLMTDASAVMVGDAEHSSTLSEVLEYVGGGIAISSTQPSRACTWFQIKS